MLKVTEHACDCCCCPNHNSVFHLFITFGPFSFLLSLLCMEMLDLKFLNFLNVQSSSHSSQVDWNHTDEEVPCTNEDICIFSAIKAALSYLIVYGKVVRPAQNWNQSRIWALKVFPESCLDGWSKLNHGFWLPENQWQLGVL
jgi:hypothetical protein